MVKDQPVAFYASEGRYSSLSINRKSVQDVHPTLPLKKLDKNKLSQRITSSSIFLQQIRNSVTMVLRRLQDYGHTTPSIHDQRLAGQILSRASKNIDVWTSTRELLQTVAQFVERSLHHEEWIIQLHRGLRLSQEQDDSETEAYLNFYLGRVQQQLHADYQLSMKHYLQSEHLFAQNSLVLKQAEAMVHRAYLFRLQEEQPLAQELVDKAFQLLDTYEDDIEGPARAYGHFVLGVLAYDQQEWSNSETELRTALSSWRQLDDPYMIALGLSDLSLPLRQQEKYEEAIKCYQAAIEQLERLDDTMGQGRLYIGLGNIYIDMNQLRQALEMYRKAEPIVRKRNNPISLAHCWSCIGNAYRELEMWTEAEDAIKKAIAQYKHFEHIEYVVDTMMDMALVFYYQDLLHEAEKIKEEAFRYLQRMEDTDRREVVYKYQKNYLNRKIDERQKKTE